MKERIKKITKTISQIRRMKAVTVRLGKDEAGKRLYNYFTSRHPKLPLVQKKALGVALILLYEFKLPDDYTKSVSGKNSAAYFSRKAKKDGYEFRAINPNLFIDGIFEVNRSAETRQGEKMDESYRNKIESYPVDTNNFYYGVFKNGILTAYLWCVCSGELVLFNRLLGHAAHLKAGVMYLLLTGAVEELIASRKDIRFAMYDTLLGASEGLKLFKERIGFDAYRVKWEMSK